MGVPGQSQERPVRQRGEDVRAVRQKHLRSAQIRHLPSDAVNIRPVGVDVAQPSYHQRSPTHGLVGEQCYADTLKQRAPLASADHGMAA